MPAGRPTAYDPKYCDEIVEIMSQGYSVTGFAGKIGGARKTGYNWAEEHPEFLHALKTAQAAAGVWWEDQLRNIVSGGEGNATAAIFGLKNRSADEWRDKREHDHASSDGSMTPVHTVVKLVAKPIPDDQDRN